MKRDGRKLDHKVLEDLRITACNRVERGEPASKVMASMGLCRTTIYGWLNKKKKRGERSLKSTRAKGPKPLLGIRKQRSLRKLILRTDPRDHGYSEALWSTGIISELIER